MDDEVRFAADLYRGTAGYYDRYRLPYPEAMIEDLARTARVSGRGRLLDLACGTGQLTFPLRQRFADVRAVDQEPDMVEVVRVKAAGQARPAQRRQYLQRDRELLLRASPQASLTRPAKSG